MSFHWYTYILDQLVTWRRMLCQWQKKQFSIVYSSAACFGRCWNIGEYFVHNLLIHMACKHPTIAFKCQTNNIHVFYSSYASKQDINYKNPIRISVLTNHLKVVVQNFIVSRIYTSTVVWRCICPPIYIQVQAAKS